MSAVVWHVTMSLDGFVAKSPLPHQREGAAAVNEVGVPEREANLPVLPVAQPIALGDTGHFAALEQPARVAKGLLATVAPDVEDRHAWCSGNVGEGLSPEGRSTIGGRPHPGRSGRRWAGRGWWQSGEGVRAVVRVPSR